MSRALSLMAVCLLASSSSARAQFGFGPPPPKFQSPEVRDDRTIVLRIHAPNAKAVRLTSGDFPTANPFSPGIDMTKGDEGVWEATVGPVPAGAYRYSFNVDGVTAIDPRNPLTSESNSNAWSMVTVPGSETSDLKEVPHGAVARVEYFSKSLNRFRRAHVYTPPGYENGADKLPVFYLLHGAMDSDASWSTVGQAGQILDNLIATGKAKPMVVVMPMGHTGPFTFGPGGDFEKQVSEFEKDFVEDLRPLIEGRYRISNERKDRAIAGLSMGGAQTLNITISHLADYGYIGVFSSGVFGISGPTAFGPGSDWEERNKAALDDAELKNGLKLVWFATGKDDFLVQTSRDTVDVLEKHGFAVTYNETEGGHTWMNWRDYLPLFAAQLFQEGAVASRDSTGAKSVAGDWAAEFDTQIGPQKYVYHLKQVGSKITGTSSAEINGEKHESTISDGAIDGDRVTLTEQLPIQGNDLTITYTGTLSGDELKLERKVGDFATESVVAKRRKGSAGAGRGGPRPDQPILDVTLKGAPAGFDRERPEIPHGKIETVQYDSKTVGIERKLVVYTPPGYSLDQKHPVLYLLHGIGDNETCWTRERGTVILDNLLAEKRIVPMIVVMPYGRASTTPVPQNIFDRGEFETYGAFEQDLLKDVIPFVESHYSVDSDRQKRALAGLSMGGGQSLNFGLHNIDTFAWVGGFSSAPNTKSASELVPDPNEVKRLKLLWLSCGNRDNLMPISQKFHEALEEMKAPHVWNVSAGGHDFNVWRNDLYFFAQKLFQD